VQGQTHVPIAEQREYTSTTIGNTTFYTKQTDPVQVETPDPVSSAIRTVMKSGTKRGGEYGQRLYQQYKTTKTNKEVADDNAARRQNGTSKSTEKKKKK
jgi:hypothetical protein